MAAKGGRNRWGKFDEPADIEQRRLRAVELRVEGRTFRAIGAELGISEAQAYKDFAHVLKRTREQADATIEEYRQDELEKLDSIWQSLHPLLKDRRAAVRAGEALTKVSAERRRLLGLDAPAKHEHSGPEGAPIAVDARSALLERLASLVAGAATGDEAKRNT